MAKIILNEEEIKDAMDYFCDWIGFKLTKKQFMEVLNENPEIKADLASMGADTCNRESFMGALARKIVGRDWPLGATSKEDTKKFFQEMKIKGLSMGYNIPADYGDNY